MQYLSVPSFDKWQHYKDRNPPWIKLHRELLNDYKFSQLSDESKAHLMLIWLLSSQLSNKIPDDAKFIQNKIGSNKKPDLLLFKELGFLVASNTIAERPIIAIVETETETETETEPLKPPKDEFTDDYNLFWDMYPKQRAGSKSKTYPAWKKAIKIATIGEIHDGTKRYAASDEVARGFAKGAAAWLNDERWKSSYDKPRKTTIQHSGLNEQDFRADTSGFDVAN